MPADATLVVIGLLLLILVGCAALVWLCIAAQRQGTDSKGELRTRLFVYQIESRPSQREQGRDDKESRGRDKESRAEMTKTPGPIDCEATVRQGGVGDEL